MSTLHRKNSVGYVVHNIHFNSKCVHYDIMLMTHVNYTCHTHKLCRMWFIDHYECIIKRFCETFYVPVTTNHILLNRMISIWCEQHQIVKSVARLNYRLNTSHMLLPATSIWYQWLNIHSQLTQTIFTILIPKLTTRHMIKLYYQVKYIPNMSYKQHDWHGRLILRNHIIRMVQKKSLFAICFRLYEEGEDNI